MSGNRQHTFLRAWRKHSGLSLQAVAEKLGMEDHTSLSRVERGIYPYSQDLLENLALIYGCDPAELLASDPERPSNIHSLWDRATVEERQRIYRVAEALIEERDAGKG